LLQQQGGGGTIECPTAISVETKTFCSIPAAGVFVHEGQGEIQAAGQTFPVAAAVRSLLGGLLAGIEGEPDDKGRDAPLLHKGTEMFQVRGELSPCKGG